MIAVVDFGAGNLRSVVNAFRAIGEDPVVSTEPGPLKEASAIVLPGVGAFGEGMKKLQAAGLVDVLNDQVLGAKKPFLGICLGMQFLAREGLEYGRHRGLGWIEGTVREMESGDARIRIPHMGWNELLIVRSTSLLEGLGPSPAFYFLHGYHFDVAGSDRDAVVAECNHGSPYVAAVEKDNIRGVQFHPEKSQLTGLKLLRNFVDSID